jgi:hypothetical protein
MSQGSPSKSPTKSGAVDDEIPPEADLQSMYAAVLDHLLTPAHVKAQLIDSQSDQKKWQTVKMYKQLFDEGPGHRKKTGGWGRDEKVLLTSLEGAKEIHMNSLNSLKVILSSANRTCMIGFLEDDGVSVLFNILRNRLKRRFTTELDTAIMHATLACLIIVMNSSIGLEKVFDEPFCMHTVAECLNFKHKVFAVQVLPIF